MARFSQFKDNLSSILRQLGVNFALFMTITRLVFGQFLDGFRSIMSAFFLVIVRESFEGYWPILGHFLSPILIKFSINFCQLLVNVLKSLGQSLI